jgi:hypothetical protein
LEKVEFLREAPFLTAGDPAERDATRVFKFFEVFLDLGLVGFFMRAGAGLIVTLGRSQWRLSSQPMGIPLFSASRENSLRQYFFSRHPRGVSTPRFRLSFLEMDRGAPLNMTGTGGMTRSAPFLLTFLRFADMASSTALSCKKGPFVRSR